MSKIFSNSRRPREPKDMHLRRGGGYERFMTMTPAEREAFTARFDREDLNPGRRLSAADKALHRRAARAAKAKMGRPIVGKGAKVVPISIERGLLKAADAFAKRHGLKRSQLVAQGLRLVMGKTSAENVKT
jgi:hypothetical protein